MEVVQLREDQVSLRDVVGMLRKLADSIDRGEVEAVEAAFVLLPLDGGYPRLFGFGDLTGTNEAMIQFDLAKQWLLNSLVEKV